MIFDIKKMITEQNLVQPKILENNHIVTDVLRLDKINAIASGNKLFKLKVPLQKALENKCTTIITKGGLYSNHLIATAYTCNIAGLRSVGVIKAHKPINLNTTLLDCVEYGMELIFMQPSDFNNIEKLKDCVADYRNSCWIDMGGYSTEGAEGCKEILSLIDSQLYTHIITAVGTGTTLAGLCLAASKHQKIIGISSMKNNFSLQEAIEGLLQDKMHDPFELIHDFHFGGFAKHPPALIDFMNDFYRKHQIPTDIVYTGKLFYAVNFLLENNYFPNNSKLLIVHTGGLQGNRSLPKHTLIF